MSVFCASPYSLKTSDGIGLLFWEYRESEKKKLFQQLNITTTDL